VVDDQLAAAVEEVEQSDRSVRAFEGVVLSDLDHRQSAAVGVQRVALPRELLLPGQKLLAGSQPLLTRHHLGQSRHHDLLSSVCGCP